MQLFEQIKIMMGHFENIMGKFEHVLVNQKNLTSDEQLRNNMVKREQVRKHFEQIRNFP